MTKKPLFTVLAILCLVVLAAPLLAWNNFGHMTVACAAYQKLTPAAKIRVNTLLQMNPNYNSWLTMIPAGTSDADKQMMIFMIAATWPDQIKRESTYTDDGTDNGNRPDGPPSSQNTGYTDLLRHKYWHFVDRPFTQDGTALPDVPQPNAQDRIALFRTVLASTTDPDLLKSYDLSWLLHLVGDIHQPLHATARVDAALPDGDAGGNKVKVCNPTCNGELHAFWDDVLGTSTSLVAIKKFAKKLPPADPSLPAAGDAAVWITESFQAAQSSVYVAPIAAGTGPFTITKKYRKAANKLAKQRAAIAGLRLAGIVNDELK
jgi:hypothetical protein